MNLHCEQRRAGPVDQGRRYRENHWILLTISSIFTLSISNAKHARIYMSERSHRRRVPVLAPAGRRSKQNFPHPSLSPSSSPSRRRTPPRQSSFKGRIEPVKVLKRCSSEPLLLVHRGVGLAHATRESHQSVSGLDAGWLIRPQTCTDLLASSSLLAPGRPAALCSELYSRDAKVVVNVTVEGSPGPIKALVGLDSTVDQTIRLVVDKYGEEGRSPKLSRDSTANFELHNSYFSLQCLNKSELIGDVGRRSFYLRICTSNAASASFVPQTMPERANSTPSCPRMFLVPLCGFFVHVLGKIFRRSRKLWRVMTCT
ncbi:hypothetical protein SAY87_024417 [Trapa incisa]|uniref:DUF7054 domain-containing protein n=1 Tax=Trapa incisa TaxID=236973 RepID=A0AAN7JF46_9MYRT|nr:hypothetical protein SAY87_024417 [Trapa incisa]